MTTKRRREAVKYKNGPIVCYDYLTGNVIDSLLKAPMKKKSRQSQTKQPKRVRCDICDTSHRKPACK